jgi:hypothetical protein
VKDKAEEIEATVNGRLTGFTVYHAIGSWYGKQEDSLVIEAISATYDWSKVMLDLAKELKALLKQECVIVTEQEINVKFV